MEVQFICIFYEYTKNITLFITFRKGNRRMNDIYTLKKVFLLNINY
jgi:hypothetical protein